MAKVMQVSNRERTQEINDRFGRLDKEPDNPVSRLDLEASSQGRGEGAEREGRKLRCWKTLRKMLTGAQERAGACEKEGEKGAQWKHLRWV